MKKINLFDFAIKVTAGVCILGILFCILMYTRYAYNADFAYATNLAREEIRQFRLYPGNWCYSTGFYVFSINLLSMPFLVFLKNEVLCRELGMMLLSLLMVFVCWKAISKYSKRMAWTLMILTFLPLRGVIHWYFYDGNYFNFAFMQMLVLALTGKILFDEKIKRPWFNYMLYVILLVIVTNDGLRNQLTITIPLFLTIAFYSYRKTENQLFEKKYKLFLAATAVGAVLGYVAYKYIQVAVGWRETDTVDYAFIEAKGMVGNVLTFFGNVYALYGINASELLSLQGIANAAN